MDPNNILFHALIVSPTKSDKTLYLINRLRGPFRDKFDYIVMIFPTFVYNETCNGFVDNDPYAYVIDCSREHFEPWLKLYGFILERTNTLFILDCCTSSKDVKGQTNELGTFGYSGHQKSISISALTQQFTSIAYGFRGKVSARSLVHD